MTRRFAVAVLVFHVLTVAVVSAIAATDARAHHPYRLERAGLEHRERIQERNLRHSSYVCREGRIGSKHRRWSCRAVHWLRRELAETRRTLAFRQSPQGIAFELLGRDRVQYRCLMSIIAVENRRMIPTLYNYAGSGAYGIPQALPGSKMASAGADWRTNPRTQLRWMIGYCRGRYGSVCGAASVHSSRGWY